VTCENALSMPAQIIDGKALAFKIRQDIAIEVAGLAQPPGLATVLVGDDPASHTYVRSKHKACEQAGIVSFGHQLPATASQAQVEELVQQLAEDARVSGILVQLPLPAGLDEEAVLARVPLSKDVDGFHPLNLGKLAMKGREPSFVPCTPAGCLALLEHAGAPLSGARAVVVGRSNIVGMPASLLLTRKDSTVTLVHSRSRDMAEIIRQADVVLVAIGRPNFVTGAMLKPGCYVIDVGMNRIAAEGGGAKLVGDVEFSSASQVAGAITPVPGGVGPMTIAMLLANTLKAAKLEK
jgi:methylenetetrahydrofolate dehydrogenase (NADP+)/methenyltetrahydrofolate cyclohydrolase